MRRLIQGIIAAVALLSAVPANAAIWYATFWGDQKATFAIYDQPDLSYSTPNHFYSEANVYASIPSLYVEGNDRGETQLDSTPGLNFFSALVRDNQYGHEAFASLLTSTNIFTQGDFFDHEIDYQLLAGDSAFVEFYPIGQASIPITGITRFTFSPFAPAVPEPATWALMILGFGAIGIALRSRRTPTPHRNFAVR